MRALIQRVSSASVAVEGQLISTIGKGLLVLLGIEDRDGQEDIDWLAGKISRMRVFDDAAGVMNLSVQDIEGELLVVSQFTLMASTQKGNRPSYIKASRPEKAIPIYQNFIKALEYTSGRPVRTGEFGAMMQVSLVNEGPVTIFIDTLNKE